MNEYRTTSGHCPVHDCDKKITIKYAEVRTLGFSGFKKMSFVCEYSAEQDICNDCPVYKQAPEG